MSIWLWVAQYIYLENHWQSQHLQYQISIDSEIATFDQHGKMKWTGHTDVQTISNDFLKSVRKCDRATEERHVTMCHHILLTWVGKPHLKIFPFLNRNADMIYGLFSFYYSTTHFIVKIGTSHLMSKTYPLAKKLSHRQNSDIKC